MKISVMITDIPTSAFSSNWDKSLLFLHALNYELGCLLTLTIVNIPFSTIVNICFNPVSLIKYI